MILLTASSSLNKKRKSKKKKFKMLLSMYVKENKTFLSTYLGNAYNSKDCKIIQLSLFSNNQVIFNVKMENLTIKSLHHGTVKDEKTEEWTENETHSHDPNNIKTFFNYLKQNTNYLLTSPQPKNNYCIMNHLSIIGQEHKTHPKQNSISVEL